MDFNLFFFLEFSYKVWNVTPINDRQQESVQKWEHGNGIDFWDGPARLNKSSRIMISPEIQSKFEQFLNIAKIQHELIIDDVERYHERK